MVFHQGTKYAVLTGSDSHN